MALFRKIHTQFWSDPFIQTLSPEKKYFFLYLLTNEKTRQCGIYEISKRQISYDTGYTIDTVSILLEYFISERKIMFSEATNEIAIKNWNKYNGNPSPKVQKLVNEEIVKIKEKKLIQYLYSTDTVSIHNRQEEVEEEGEREVEKEREVGLPNSPILIGDAEKELLGNQIQFEKICMAAGAESAEAAKKSLRKFHLHLEEKNKYPQSRKQIYAGFEKWLLNEKKFNYGGSATHQQFSSGGTKPGTSEARINKAKNW
jgi:hypothetical protein